MLPAVNSIADHPPVQQTSKLCDGVSCSCHHSAGGECLFASYGSTVRHVSTCAKSELVVQANALDLALAEGFRQMEQVGPFEAVPYVPVKHPAADQARYWMRLLLIGSLGLLVGLTAYAFTIERKIDLTVWKMLSTGSESPPQPIENPSNQNKMGVVSLSNQ